FDLCLSNEFVQAQVVIIFKVQTAQPVSDQFFNKTVEALMPVRQAPVKPAQFIVLAVGIVVAELGPPCFIPHQKHGCAKGEEVKAEKVFYLPAAQLLNHGIIGRTFKATVPAKVIISAIPVLFPVCEVVLLRVSNEVVQGKAIMTGNEINALL